MNRLIRENPQWSFTSNCEILPDKIVDTRATADMPVWEKYVPWALLGILLLVAQAVVLPGRAMGSQKRLSRNMFFFILPTLLLLVVFSYYPIFSAFYHSFFEWEGQRGSDLHWAGKLQGAYRRQCAEEIGLERLFADGVRHRSWHYPAPAADFPSEEQPLEILPPGDVCGSYGGP